MCVIGLYSVRVVFQVGWFQVGWFHVGWFLVGCGVNGWMWFFGGVYSNEFWFSFYLWVFYRICYLVGLKGLKMRNWGGEGEIELRKGKGIVYVIPM